MSHDPGQPAILVEQLSKVYHRNRSLWSWLRKGLGLGKQDEPQDYPPEAVHALKNIHFSVRRGEAFGIIGRNGAGKSTLLQILAGTLQPNAGRLSINGRVTALLELGSGFNPEFSGRENIYLAGSILGITREQMDLKYAEIEHFAEVGRFIDQPVKTYSTGMLMRVAFAVAVSVEPDILIIDEALSVGDILFQQKCNRRLRELLSSGVTLLVVTHDTSFVLNMCHRALWIDRGEQRFLGGASECVRAYVTAMSAAAGNDTCQTTASDGMAETRIPSLPANDLSQCQRLGDGSLRIAALWIQDEQGEASQVFRTGSWCKVSVLIEALREAKAASAGCELRDRHGQVVFATGLRVTRRLIDRIPAGESRLVTLRFKMELKEGQYSLDVGCGAGGFHNEANSFERIPAAAILDVSPAPEQDVIHGIARLPYEVDSFRVLPEKR